MGKLNDKIALVTGAGNGIGQGIARRFAAEGAIVGINDVSEEIARKSVDEIGDNAFAAPADIRDLAQITHMVAAILEKYGRIDILVNCAGGNLGDSGILGDPAKWDRVLDVNLKGTLYCCHAVLPLMQNQKYGKILNFGSVMGVAGSVGGGEIYAAAKGAMESLTKSLAMRFGPDGINVNCISPGAIVTNTKPHIANLASGTWLGRTGTVDEVAGLAAFLCSSEADFITGVNYLIDGGRVLGVKSNE